MMRVVRCAVVVLLLAGAGCGGADSATDDGAAEASGGSHFEVTVSDEGCTVDGPRSVPPGDVTFVLTDETEDGGFELAVRKIVDGYTYQDLVDAQPVPGAMFPRPDFIEEVYMRNALVAGMDLEDGESGWAWAVEPGPHEIHVFRFGPSALWGCAPLDVVDDG